MIALLLAAALLASGPQAPATSTPAVPEISLGAPLDKAAIRNQRDAAKLYLKGVHLLEQEQPEAAFEALDKASDLDSANPTYKRAAELARQSSITHLVQSSVHLAERGDNAAAHDSLLRAQILDPASPVVLQHLHQLADAVQGAPIGTRAAAPLDAQMAPGSASPLQPSRARQSFHLRTSQPQAIDQVFRAFGIIATVDPSVQNRPVRIDADNATFEQAMDLLALTTHTFYEPVDPHRVLVTMDTRDNRNQLQSMQMETISLPGLSSAELTDIGNLARNVFDAQQSSVEPTAGTMTLRAPTRTIQAFNQTISQLVMGRSQLDLDVKIIQIAHTSARETGVTAFQQTGAYNALSEVNSIIAANQSAVQQILATGLVANDTTLTNKIEIVLILLAAGQLSGPPFNQGLIGFGNGITGSILAVSPATLTMSLNSSDTRILDDVHLRLADQETGTIRTGQRYPIESSQYSSLAVAAAASVGASNQIVPQIQYEDLGLTLKATPKIMRSADVALTLDLKIEALGGSSLNDIPILNNQSMSGVLTLREGETAVLLSDLNRQESRALSGNPGVADIPGLEDINDVQKNVNIARLLILVTPSVVRDMNPAGSGPILKIDKPSTGH